MPTAGQQICTSGTPNPGAPAQIILDATAALPPPLDVPGLFSIIWSVVGLYALVTSDFCSNPPRYPGDPVLQDLVDITGDVFQIAKVVDKYRQLLAYAAWPQYCSCTAYVAPIVSYPPAPSYPTTVSLPAQSTPLDVTCSISDLYNKLNGIMNLLRLILATVGPQSYMLGASHIVTGTGEIAVSGIVGCIVHAISRYPGSGFEITDPVRYFDSGWIAFGDANGWYEHRRIQHDPQFFTGVATGVTRIGYSCEMVSSLEITELLPNVLYQGN